MDAKELRKKKLKLESDIVVAVIDLVDRFKDDTGFSPCAISLNVGGGIYVNGNPYAEHYVTGCSVSIDI